jgi:hypothetical protein
LVHLEFLLNHWDLFAHRHRIGGVAPNTRTASGSPSASVSSPTTICNFPFLPSRLQPITAGHIVEKQARRRRFPAEITLEEFRFDFLLAGAKINPTSVEIVFVKRT